MSAPPGFSVVVIARDEARSLPRLLASLAGFRERGGEVLVVDTGSGDDTIEIARAAGCRVESVGDRFATRLTAADAARIDERFALAGEGPLTGEGQRLFHFGAARQHAGLRARNEHVLQLDASDEVVLDPAVLDRHVAAGAGNFQYVLHLGGLSLRVSRFYDRRRFVWRGRVHEGLYLREGAPDGPAPTVRCDDSELRVRHHKDEGKARHYLAGLALAAIEDPREPRWKHYLGRELYYGGRYRSAIAVLLDHAGMDAAPPAQRGESLCHAGACLEALGEADAAGEHYARAFALDPTRREPLLRRATVCQRRLDFQGAVDHATAALAIPRTSGLAEMDANYTHAPHALLYWGLFWLGRRAEARVHWEACRRLAPDDALFAAHARLFAGMD